MKTWMCWVLLIIVVAALILLGWWLSSTLSVMTCYYICVALNGIVFCYLLMQKKKS